eukprot:g65390.t1
MPVSPYFRAKKRMRTETLSLRETSSYPQSLSLPSISSDSQQFTVKAETPVSPYLKRKAVCLSISSPHLSEAKRNDYKLEASRADCKLEKICKPQSLRRLEMLGVVQIQEGVNIDPERIRMLWERKLRRRRSYDASERILSVSSSRLSQTFLDSVGLLERARHCYQLRSSCDSGLTPSDSSHMWNADFLVVHQSSHQCYPNSIPDLISPSEGPLLSTAPSSSSSYLSTEQEHPSSPPASMRNRILISP